jgi:hypothetical protein
VVFTDRAVSLIQAHAAAKDGAIAAATQPFFLFLAFHNVHDTCQGQSGGYPHEKQRLNAPMGTVARHSHIKLDTWKVQAAMTTELDYGVVHTDAFLFLKYPMTENRLRSDLRLVWFLILKYRPTSPPRSSWRACTSTRS